MNSNASTAPPVVRAKVNSIAQTGTAKARKPIPATVRSFVRSPSPERLPRVKSNASLRASPSTSASRVAPELKLPNHSPKPSPLATHDSNGGTRILAPRARLVSVSSPSSLVSPAPKSGLSTGAKVVRGSNSPTRSPSDETNPSMKFKAQVSGLGKTRPNIYMAPPSAPASARSPSPTGKIRAQPLKDPLKSGPKRVISHSRATSTSQLIFTKSPPPDASYVPPLLPPLPLPPQSPPNSTLSARSYSTDSSSLPSSSRSPVIEPLMAAINGIATDLSPITNGQPSPTVSPDSSDLGDGGLVPLSPLTEETNPVDGVHSEKATAKSNRKIADLEITNKSLLAINANLESAKRKLSKDIHDLRKQLRAARLALPPSRFRSLKETDPEFVRELFLEGSYTGLAQPDHEEQTTDTDDEEEEGAGDERFDRVSSLVQGMLLAGQKALETKVESAGTLAVAPRLQVLHSDDIIDVSASHEQSEEEAEDDGNEAPIAEKAIPDTSIEELLTSADPSITGVDREENG